MSSGYEAVRANTQHALVSYLQATLRAEFIVVHSALLMKNDGRTDHLIEAEQIVRKAAESVRRSVSLVKDVATRTEIQNQLSELERIVGNRRCDNWEWMKYIWGRSRNF